MPTYTYTAVSKKGEHLSGEEIIKDEHALARMLREKGYVLLRAEKKENKFVLLEHLHR